MKRNRRRILLLTFLVLGLALGGWASVIWLGAQRAQAQLLAASTTLRQGPLSASAAGQACGDMQIAAAQLRGLIRLTRPVAPLLRSLSFLPRLGPTLETAPAALELGKAGAELASAVCQAAAPALPALEQAPDQRLAHALQLLQATPPDWPSLSAAAERAAASWRALPPAALERGLLAPYAEQLRRIGPQLEELPAALQTAQALLPAADVLLGLSRPSTLIVLGQNPFELRPTGGFIGSLGTLTVTGGRLGAISYGDSAELDVPAPAGSDFPLPYARYLRASRWYLRDANWWSDFPTSARTVEAFWQLNGREPVDGVLALDLYALQELVRALGGVEVPGYGAIPGENTLEAIFSAYDSHGLRSTGDKAFLAALLRATATRLQRLPLPQLPALAAALGRSLQQRHMSIFVHDEAAATALQAQGWDGALRTDPGDYLQIVDTDLSYSDAQAFIDEQISYEVELGPALNPLTATVTVTLTNRYDPWHADLSAGQIYGLCYNVASNQLERVPGCYGDYVRFYSPSSAAPLSLEGADGPLEPASEGTRAVAGAYVRLYPGQTRVLRLRYRQFGASSGSSYRLTLQKQAGTLARPLVLVVRAGEQRLTLQTDLWVDRQVVVTRQDGRLTLSQQPAQRHPQHDQVSVARSKAFVAAQRQWEQGDHQAALRGWRESETLDRAVDWARGLLYSDPAAASALATALAQEAPVAGRAAYLQGEIAEQQGQQQAAMAAYERALSAAGTNDAPRRALALLVYRAGDTQRALGLLQATRDPAGWLRRQGREYIYASRNERATESLELLLLLLPTDRDAYARLYEIYTSGIGAAPDWQRANTLCQQALAQLPRQADWYLRRATTWEQLGQPVQALADIEHATVLSPTNSEVWSRLGWLRWQARRDAPGALAAFAGLRRHAPQQPAGYLGGAAILAQLQQLEPARQLLREGMQQLPTAPELPLELGHLLLAESRAAEALPVLEQALALDGGQRPEYYRALGDAYRALARPDQARQAYQQALALDPNDQHARDWLEEL